MALLRDVLYNIPDLNVEIFLLIHDWSLIVNTNGLSISSDIKE